MKLVLIFILGIVNYTVSQDVDRKCVSLHECPKLYQLYNSETNFTASIELLKSWKCGYDEDSLAKVWCDDSCTTPDGVPGKCTPLHQCYSFLQSINSIAYTAQSFKKIREYKCLGKSSTISVCCRSEKQTEQPPTVVTNLLPKIEDGQCGNQIANRIVGGSATEIDEYTWMARLNFVGQNPENTLCAGTLINNRYVLSAAHCFSNLGVSAMTHVTLGDYDTRTKRDCVTKPNPVCAKPDVVVEVENVTIHPGWFKRPRGNVNHDIALIRLREAVNFTDFIKPICLPSKHLDLKNQERLIVAGWGRTEIRKASFVKLQTTVLLADKLKCIQKYKNEIQVTVGDGMMCAGGEGNRDSCAGDSGGPLMYPVISNEGDALWHLVGIVSFGNQCGVAGSPALYTDVPTYYDWIVQTIRP